MEGFSLCRGDQCDFYLLNQNKFYGEISDLEYNDSIMFYKPDGSEYSSKDIERIEQETCDK